MTTPLKKGAVASKWLRAVQRLLPPRSGGALKVATQLTEFLDEDTFANSGRLIGCQGVPGLSAATRLCKRAVQKNLRRLELLGVVAPTISRGGRGNYNWYELRMPPGSDADQVAGGDDKETPHVRAGFSNGKPRTPVQGLSDQNRARPFQKPRTPVPETPYARAPVLQEYSNSTSAPTTNGDTGGPRQRVNALGPPLGALDATLRQNLGGRFKYLATARLVPTTAAGAVRLSVLTDAERVLIRRNCEAEILAAAGASYLEFDVELSADQPNPRRRP